MRKTANGKIASYRGVMCTSDSLAQSKKMRGTQMLRYIVLITMLFAISSCNQKQSSDYYCNLADIEANRCSKGDVAMLLTSPALPLKYCDFETSITVHALIERQPIYICVYRGAERKPRSPAK